MHHLLRLLALAAVILVVSASGASAQLFNPFHVNGGYDFALAAGRDSLASDAYLVYAGTFGGFDLTPFGFPGVILNFYQDDQTTTGADVEPGQADAWGYVFHSPSLQRTKSLVVVNSPIFGGMSVRDVPAELPLPSDLDDLLDLNINGAQSDSLMARLKREATYIAFHAQYPLLQPDFITLGNTFRDDLQPPSSFTANGPTWTVTFDPTGDTSGMVCFVSAGSAQTVCTMVAPTSAPLENATAIALDVRALPNPARGTLRIAIGERTPLRGEISLELLDARGTRVLDLVPSLRANDLRFADADVSELPSGVYFCRLTIDGASHVTPVTVVAP